jgi:hypothetical protein
MPAGKSRILDFILPKSIRHLSARVNNSVNGMAHNLKAAGSNPAPATPLPLKRDFKTFQNF